MLSSGGLSGVSNCYVFKSRLQEYAHKVGLPTPVYETMKEGPSHEPVFRSTVIVNDIRYDSLPGFLNRKAAEQSAAEIALMELAKSGAVQECITQPVHETGLCKNLLQEYAQKMNYAIPVYECEKAEASGKMPLFSCTVEIGGMRYIGGAARTKKEAEIKAARTALLAIHLSSSQSSGGTSKLTVIPGKKREIELVKNSETPSGPKPKKARRKKAKKRTTDDVISSTGIPWINMYGLVGSEMNRTVSGENSRIGACNMSGLVGLEVKKTVSAANSGILGCNVSCLVGLEASQTVCAGVQVTGDVQMGTQSMSPKEEVPNVNPHGGEVCSVEGVAQLGMQSAMTPNEEVSNVIPHGGDPSQTVGAKMQVEDDVQVGTKSMMNPKEEVPNVNPHGREACSVEVDAQLDMQSLMKPEEEVVCVVDGKSGIGHSETTNVDQSYPDGGQPSGDQTAFTEEVSKAGEVASGDTVNPIPMED